MCSERQHTVSTPGSQGVAGGNRRVASTNGFDGLSTLSLHTGLRRLIGRPIDVRNVEKEDVDASPVLIASRCPMPSASTLLLLCSKGNGGVTYLIDCFDVPAPKWQ